MRRSRGGSFVSWGQWLGGVLAAVTDGLLAPDPPLLRDGQVRELTTGPGVPEPEKPRTLGDEGWIYVHGEDRYIQVEGGAGG